MKSSAITRARGIVLDILYLNFIKNYSIIMYSLRILSVP